MKLSLIKLTNFLVYAYVVILLYSTSVGATAVKVIRVLLAAALALYIMNVRHFRLNTSSYCISSLLFLAFNALMISSAYNKGVAKEYVISVMFIIIIDVLAFQYLCDQNIFDGIFHAYIVGAVVKALRTYLSSGFLAFISSRSAENVSANTIGTYCAFAVVFCFMFIVKGKREPNSVFRRWNKLYYLAAAANLLFMVLSASRKSFIFLLVPIAIWMLLNSRNPLKLIRNAFLILLLGIGVYFAIMKIPFLYDLVGHRIESMLMGLLGYETDSSTNTRMLLMEYGIKWFKQRPWTGYGLLNFQELNMDIRGSIYYAHNNYIELLVDCGIIGTLIYYWPYIAIFFAGLKYRKALATAEIIAFGVICSMIIGEIGMVTYFTAQYQFLLMVFFVMFMNRKTLLATQERRINNIEKTAASIA